MKSKLKKNLWWIISSIVLFVPIAGLISSSQYDLSFRLSLCCISFILLSLIMAMTGTIANKIKKVILKVLWIIFGLAIYAIGWLFTLVFIAMIEPATEEEVKNRKEDFRDMIYREFDAEDNLDRVVGIELPQYRIVDSECTYVSTPPSETEYNVNLKIYFPEGLPSPVWQEIRKRASNNASNPLSEEYVINEWGTSGETPGRIFYKCEDSGNVGCTITFESDCDTVYVTCYKW